MESVKKKLRNVNVYYCVGAIILIVLLIVFITMNCYMRDNFTAPGLTLTLPPSWFTTLSGRPYKMDEWKSKQYLDRYPFYDFQNDQWLSSEESDTLASAYRFWRF